MDLEHLPSLPLGLLRREHSRLEDLFKKLTGYSNSEYFQLYRKIVQEKNKKKTPIFYSDESCPIPEDKKPNSEQTVLIATYLLKILNNYLRFFDTKTETFNPLMRKNELDENGEPAFFLSHPIKVASLAFDCIPAPEEISNLPQNEQAKLWGVAQNPYELSITAFLHDFVEDVFGGQFDIPHPNTQKTATKVIWEILNDPLLGIPKGARERIFNRIVILTKPPQRYTNPDKELTREEAVQQYLEHYKTYLQQIIASRDPISQYIKVIDILQNAQSQKGDDPKRNGKAKLQADFINTLFPNFVAQLLQKRPEFFEKLSDRNLVEEVQKRIQKNIDDVITQ